MRSEDDAPTPLYPVPSDQPNTVHLSDDDGHDIACCKASEVVVIEVARPRQPLAIARVQRFPEALVAFRHEAARLGAPLTEHEEAAIAPLYRALKIEMIRQAMAAATPDPDFIAQQLVKAGG